jgi:hypothetical protein
MRGYAGLRLTELLGNPESFDTFSHLLPAHGFHAGVDGSRHARHGGAGAEYRLVSRAQSGQVPGTWRGGR